MSRFLCLAWAGTALLLSAGCMTGPLQENPLLFQSGGPPCDNPVFLPLGPDPHVYNVLFEKVYNVLTEANFEVGFSNRYDGRLETLPITSPGLGQPWKPGSPDFHQRLLATLQSIRHRAIVTIQPARDGGYFIKVEVLKELEDLPRPIKASANAVAFRGDATVDRQYDVVEVGIYEGSWIPIGHDAKMEQVLLDRIAHIDLTTNGDKKLLFPPKAK